MIITNLADCGLDLYDVLCGFRLSDLYIVKMCETSHF